VGHHQYPNIKELDPDLGHFLHTEGVLYTEGGWRMHKEHPYETKYGGWRQWIAYQPMFLSFFMAFIHDLEFLRWGSIWGLIGLSTRHWSWARFLRHALGRFLVVVVGLWPLISVIYLRVAKHRAFFVTFDDFRKATVFCAFPWAMHSLTFFFFSQVSHINEECFSPESGIAVDWGAHQVSASWDWSTTSPFAGFLSLGLNNQIVHHMFPSVHPCHYPGLSPVIAEVAERHGVDYKRRSSDSFGRAVVRFISWISAINDPETLPATEQQPSK
jgi:fatty acid desaturase